MATGPHPVTVSVARRIEEIRVDTKTPRATWRGTIQFGLASMNVGLFTAVRSHDVQTHSIHRDCGGRVRLRKVCEIDGKELHGNEIQRSTEHGYPIPDTPAADDDGKRVMQVRGFVAATDVDTRMHAKPYHVQPDKGADKAYAVMRAAMAKTRTVAVATIAFNGAESLAVLRPEGDSIVLQLIVWPDEMVEPPSVDRSAPRVTPAELAAARGLIDAMRIELASVRDDANDRLAAVVASLPTVAATPAAVVDGTPIDLMAALEASVKATRKGGKR